jgi:hypothetical protein
VPPHEGCRLPLNIGFLPLPVDPISKAMTHPLRSTGITPLQHYKETDSSPQLDSDDAATYERFIRCGSAKPVANERTLPVTLVMSGAWETQRGLLASFFFCCQRLSMPLGSPVTNR